MAQIRAWVLSPRALKPTHREHRPSTVASGRVVYEPVTVSLQA